ncbi:AbrB family transcriptional regulator [Shewanella nanhaiensis]|uniref:AbrB family transcriptional regulator n=1 Tax=Shewanella nanhaiensis TaxID=2864872 RepID=A0ABS7E739_9GAMM|nr:AbrB family transcriptional regulator [Shewanella nanhaiensis]MBW8185501.1 AbrB family transcriptional regulator [Shewanella nanhaiensis]
MKVNAKRQITLPVEQCKIAQIVAGDNVACFVDRLGVISIVKQTKGSAKGILANSKVLCSMNENTSRQSAIS